MVLTRHYQDKYRVIHFSKSRVRDAIYYLSTAKQYYQSAMRAVDLPLAREEYTRLQMKYEAFLNNCIQEAITLLKMY